MQNDCCRFMTNVLRALGYSKCWHSGTFVPNHAFVQSPASQRSQKGFSWLSLLGRLVDLGKRLPLPYSRADMGRISTLVAPSPGQVAQTLDWQQPECPSLAFSVTPPTAKSLHYWSAAAIHEQENDKPVEWACASSWDRTNRTDTNISAEKKHATTVS